MRAFFVAALPLGLLVACAASAPEPAPPLAEPRASAPPAVTSAPPAASSAPAPVQSAPMPPPPVKAIVPYNPLPKVTACGACSWPGTGCSEASPKECALDPQAWWEVQVERVKPAGKPAEGELVCVTASSDRSACGKTGKKKQKGWTVLEAEKEGGKKMALSTAELLGLQQTTIATTGRETPATVVPSLRVNAALFKEGFAMSHADGDEVWLTIKPGKAPAAAPAPESSREPQPGEGGGASAEATARAKELARKVAAIDARLGSLQRKTALTHRKSGFEIRLIAFYEGKELVRVHAQLPYVPPMVDTVFYFEKGKLIAEHTVAAGTDEQGNPKNDITTSFFDDKGRFWSNAPGFDPKKTDPAPKDLASELEKAIKSPAYHVADGSL